MPEFAINLIKNRVMPLHKRRRLFWGMMLYLALCAASLATILWMAARALVRAARHRDDMALIVQEFRESHPGQDDILLYAESLMDRGGQLAGVLEVVKENIRSRADLAKILAGITGALPEDIQLVDFSLDGAKQMVTFDLAAQIVSEADHLTDAGELVGLWNHDARLASQLQQIQSVASNRRSIDGKSVFVLRFSGKSAAGGL